MLSQGEFFSLCGWRAKALKQDFNSTQTIQLTHLAAIHIFIKHDNNFLELNFL